MLSDHNTGILGGVCRVVSGCFFIASSPGFQGHRSFVPMFSEFSTIWVDEMDCGFFFKLVCFFPKSDSFNDLVPKGKRETNSFSKGHITIKLVDFLGKEIKKGEL